MNKIEVAEGLLKVSRKMDSASTSSNASNTHISSARCIYNSKHSALRYTLIPYSEKRYKTPISESIKGYEYLIHGIIEFTEESGWTLHNEKKDCGKIVRPILENLAHSKKIHDFMKKSMWLILKGDPSYAEEIVGEMLFDDIYRIDSYDIWKVKIDGKRYNVAVATDINAS